MSDLTHNLLLLPIAGWALGLVALYFTDQTALALFLCYPVALWNVAVTVSWGIRALGRWKRGEVSTQRTDDAVQDVINILTVSAATPAIVFIAEDPLARSAWSTCVGVLVVCIVLKYSGRLLLRTPTSVARIVALAIATAGLPLNASGAVTVGMLTGTLARWLPT